MLLHLKLTELKVGLLLYLVIDNGLSPNSIVKP
jgi:hypothetical protein